MWRVLCEALVTYSYLTLVTALGGSYRCVHFADEETEAYRVTALGTGVVMAEPGLDSQSLCYDPSGGGQ